MELLTDIAIQMKGSLSFLLGLGGLFSLVKGGLMATIAVGDVSEKIDKRKHTLIADVKANRRRQVLKVVIAALLFLVALFCYVSWVSYVDVKALESGEQTLGPAESVAVGAVVVCAIGIFVVDVLLTIDRQRLKQLLQQK